jgi:CheY-like chemotaxis protein
MGGPWWIVWKESGVAAVHYMMQNRLPDLLITSLDFPVMTGFEVIEWVRVVESYGRIPIIAHSTSSDPDAKAHCLVAGADAVIDDWRELHGWNEAHRREAASTSPTAERLER